MRDVRIHYFQYRYLHLYLSTNYYLRKIRIQENAMCTFCENHEETLEHLFWLCSYSNSFWQSISVNYLPHSSDPPISYRIISFGYIDKDLSVYNFIIFHAKYFLYFCKLHNTLPSTIGFYSYFKNITEIEYHIANSNNDERLLDRLNFFCYVTRVCLHYNLTPFAIYICLYFRTLI